MTDEPRTRLANLVEAVEDRGYENRHGKAFPYLGWFWRDLGSYVHVSWHDGKLWVNVPKKWDYPSTRLDDEEVEELCEQLCEVLEKVLDQGGQLEEDRVRIQEILHGYVDELTERWFRCERCGFETKYWMDWGNKPQTGIEAHLDDEHGIEEYDRMGDAYERFEKYRIDTDPSSDTHGDYQEIDHE